MTTFQKIIKYLAMAFAIFLTVSIIGGIVSAIAGVGYFFGNNNVTDNMKNYSVLESVNSMEIEISASMLEVRTGDNYDIKSNHKDISVNTTHGVLKVKEKKVASWLAGKGAKTIITIPRDAKLDNVHISTGAEKVKIEYIETDNLSLELGAGEVDIETLKVNNKTTIDGGVGEIDINNGKLNKTKIDMGIGELSYTGVFTDNCEISSGIGELHLSLTDDKSNYKFEAEKGVGEIRIDGKKIHDYETYGSGKNIIELSGGVGEIKVEFL